MMLTSKASKSSTGALCCKQDERWKSGYYFRACSSRIQETLADEFFRPTLMGTGPNVADAGWQVRVIDTILQNTYQIFDDD